MTSLGPVAERFAEVNGVRLHDRISGEGSGEEDGEPSGARREDHE